MYILICLMWFSLPFWWLARTAICIMNVQVGFLWLSLKGMWIQPLGSTNSGCRFLEGCGNYFVLWLSSCLKYSFHQIFSLHKYKMSSPLFFLWIVCSLNEAANHLTAKFLDCHFDIDPLQILVSKMRVTKQLVTQFPILFQSFPTAYGQHQEVFGVAI